MEIKAAVVTVSDSRGPDNDASGDRLVQLIRNMEAEVVDRRFVIDEQDEIKELLLELSGREDINLVLTTGGTGLGPRDNTPEATLQVIEHEVPGIAEAIRRETYSRTPMSMLSRAVCGVRSGTLIVNLPGSPKAVEECFDVIKPVLSHALDLIAGRTAH